MDHINRLAVHQDSGAATIDWNDSLAKGLLHFFPLNENVGTKVVDTCGRCKTSATWTGTVNRGGSKWGRTLNFPSNGSTNSINTNYSVKLPLNAITVSVWLRPNFAPAHWSFPVTALNDAATTSDQFALSYSDNVTGAPKFGVSASGGAHFSTSDSSVLMIENAWNHVVGLFDGANVTVYVNGQQGATAAAVTTVNNTQPTQSLRFGDNGLANAWHAGGIANVAIWNRALKLTEIRRLYGDPLAPLYNPGRIDIAAMVINSPPAFLETPPARRLEIIPY
jgi:hypothetical protein